MAERPVVVVTGGAAGIGAAIAEELGRKGSIVVTLDPVTTLDGSTRLETSETTTAARIVAAGGAARASEVSVTDAEAVRGLFASLVEEFGRLDVVVNAAGISRHTDFASGLEEDWEQVLEVHLGGYLNVLAAALAIMTATGSGRILGVTSGGGWRAGNAGAYGVAKRAVAALTWQLGRVMPTGVSVNALSPIAATRMVTEALARHHPKAADTGGLALGLTTMPPPDHLGPVGAYLAGPEFSWSTGQVIFSNGAEIAPIAAPQLLEVVRGRDVASLPHALAACFPTAFVAAESSQATNGASNPRFGRIFDEPTSGDGPAAATTGTCIVASDDGRWGAAAAQALRQRGLICRGIGTWDGGRPLATGFASAAEQLAHAARDEAVDAIVIVRRGAGASAPSDATWSAILDSHARLGTELCGDAAWMRAVAEHAKTHGAPVRVVTLTDATSPGGRTRAQAITQLARGSRAATSERVAAFSVAVETRATADTASTAELLAQLVCDADSTVLAGAELAVGEGWLGLRSHPAPVGSITFGGPEIPDWLDAAVRLMTAQT